MVTDSSPAMVRSRSAYDRNHAWMPVFLAHARNTRELERRESTMYDCAVQRLVSRHPRRRRSPAARVTNVLHVFISFCIACGVVARVLLPFVANLKKKRSTAPCRADADVPWFPSLALFLAVLSCPCIIRSASFLCARPHSVPQGVTHAESEPTTRRASGA